MWRFVNFDVLSFGDVPKSIVSTSVKFDDVSGVDKLTVDHYKETDGIIVRLGTTLDANILSRFVKLKILASVTTGLDHIDIDYCEQHGIRVVTLKGETEFLRNISSTPEMTWALLLALVRKLPQAHTSVLAGRWERESFFGHELNGTNFGVIGFGRVGKILGRYADAFGMRVYAYDNAVAGAQSYPFRQVPLDELLSEAHVVSVNLPLTEETRHFIGRGEFERMRNGAWFLNTARGAIVDEQALLDALEQGRIAGAAIDVIEGETKPGHITVSHPLVSYARKHDNLLFSPHISGSTFEAMQNTAIFISQKINIIINELSREQGC